MKYIDLFIIVLGMFTAGLLCGSGDWYWGIIFT